MKFDEIMYCNDEKLSSEARNFKCLYKDIIRCCDFSNRYLELLKLYLKEMRDNKIYKYVGFDSFEEYCKSEPEIVHFQLMKEDEKLLSKKEKMFVDKQKEIISCECKVKSFVEALKQYINEMRDSKAYEIAGFKTFDDFTNYSLNISEVLLDEFGIL